MFELQKRGTRICLPVVLDKTTIEFRRLTPDCQLIETGFGTKGPGPGAEILDPQIMLIPLAAFDCHGGRIGYGAGFYDRAIEKLQKKGPSPLLVGFAFSCQEVEKVPMEPHDQHLNMIITETGLIEVKQAKESIA